MQSEELFSSLGLRVHKTKGEREGTTELPQPGNFVDTRRAIVPLQLKRLEKVETPAAALLRHAAKHRHWARIGTLRSFCGAAISATLSVPQARCRTQSLLSAMRPLLRAEPSGRPKGRDLCLGHQALSDLRLWAQLSDHALLGRALWTAPEDAVVHTDASTSRSGATWNGVVPGRGFHGPKHRHLNINAHELAAVRLLLSEWYRHLMAPKWINGSAMTYLLQDAGIQLPQVTALSRRVRTLEFGTKNAPVCSNSAKK